ncbi:MAG TPA: cation:proton antiporter [Vicinamibacterales bacterium]|nr:cation:proton antiporter [Vicinamibacterales bacterium]
MARALGAIGVRLVVPLFFAFAGLRTDVTRLSTLVDWAVCGAVVLVAPATKFGACAAAARMSGVGARDALTIGALMNARGLMELIVLNIGDELGLLTPTLCAMFVLMAVASTCMAGPLARTAPEPLGKRTIVPA